jgi:hypothetical protein
MPFFLGFETPRFIQAKNPKPRLFRKVPVGIARPAQNTPIGYGNFNAGINNIPLNNIRITPLPRLDLIPIPPLNIRPKRVQPKAKVGQKIIRTDLTDLTSISSVKNVRRKINLPEGQVAEIESDDNLIYELTINFFVDVNALASYNGNRRPVDICNVALTTSEKGNLVVFQNKAFAISKILKDSKTIDAITKEAQEGQGSSVFYPVQLAFEINQAQLEKIDDFDLSLLFSFFNKSKDVNKSVVKSLEFAIPYNLTDDLRAFYVVKEPVKISAATLSFTQTLLTIEKAANCNAEAVAIFRRKLVNLAGESDRQVPFEHVTTIDFEGQTDTKTDEAYQTTIIDGDSSTGIGGDVDNSFEYLYRAVPIGKFGAPAIIFDEDITKAITQANFETGADFKVFPIHKRGRMPRGLNIQGGNFGSPRRPMRFNPKDFGVPIKTSKVTGFTFKDSNFLGPDALVPDLQSGISLVSYYTDKGINVIASNLDNSKVVSILRKNLTTGDRKYAYVETQNTDDVDSINVLDEEVIDGHAYQYVGKIMTDGGLCAFSNDTTTTIYRDRALLPDFGVDLEVDPPVVEGQEVQLEIDVKLPQNILSLVAALLGGRDESDVFLQDIIRGRKDLTPQISLVVSRMNITTGEEVAFKMTSDPAKFTTKKRGGGDEKEDDKLPNVSSFTFTDQNLAEGNEYIYEVKVNLREPLSLTDETTSIIRAGQEPFIFQACKSSSPLFINRGILPPTQSGQDFIQQRNIQNGRNRLLNLLTSDDEFDLGLTGIKKLVPGTSTIRIHKKPSKSLRIVSHRLARQNFSELRWDFKDVKKVSHFEIFSEDTYTRGRDQRFIKTSLVADVAAQTKKSSSRFSFEDGLDILTEDDRNDFEDPTIIDVQQLQRETETFKVNVKRRYIINVVGLDESIIETVTSKSVTISSKSLAGSRRGVKFAFAPKVIQKKFNFAKASKKKNKIRIKTRKLNYMNLLARKGNKIAKNHVNVLKLNVGFAANRGKAPNKVKQLQNFKVLSKNLKVFQPSPPRTPKKNPGKGMAPKGKQFNLFKLSPFG